MTRTPYAFAQSLTLLKNKSKAITLTGSAGTLTYSVVTPPAHGTLTGTVPNLTYTPTANYIGLDSFTFKTKNGTTDATPATVSINVIPANTFSVNFYVACRGRHHDDSRVLPGRDRFLWKRGYFHRHRGRIRRPRDRHGDHHSRQRHLRQSKRRHPGNHGHRLCPQLRHRL
jgi:hypothetical protein